MIGVSWPQFAELCQVGQSRRKITNLATKSGAGEGIRTLDVLLGKLPRDKLAAACWTNRLPPF